MIVPGAPRGKNSRWGLLAREKRGKTIRCALGEQGEECVVVFPRCQGKTIEYTRGVSFAGSPGGPRKAPKKRPHVCTATVRQLRPNPPKEIIHIDGAHTRTCTKLLLSAFQSPETYFRGKNTKDYELLRDPFRSFFLTPQK